MVDVVNDQTLRDRTVSLFVDDSRPEPPDVRLGHLDPSPIIGPVPPFSDTDSPDRNTVSRGHPAGECSLVGLSSFGFVVAVQGTEPPRSLPVVERFFAALTDMIRHSAMLIAGTGTGERVGPFILTRGEIDE